MPHATLAQAAFLSASEDLDALRTTLDTRTADGPDDITLPLARLLAACSGTLRAEAAALRAPLTPPEGDA